MGDDTQEPSKADELFEASMKVAFVESDLHDLLHPNYTNFTYDPYDSSLEIYGMKGELTEELRIKLRDFGFYQLWTHTVLKQQDYSSRGNRQTEGERHYILDRPLNRQK